METATSCGAAIGHPKNGKQLLPMDLLDEYWFFNNTLKLNSRKVSSKPPKTPQSNRIDDDSVAVGQTLVTSPSVPPPCVHPSEMPSKEGGDRDDEVLPVPLMWTPSMPSPYSNGIDDTDHKGTQFNSDTKSKGSKLRHSSSTLGCHHHSWHSAFEVTQIFKNISLHGVVEIYNIFHIKRNKQILQSLKVYYSSN